MREDYDPQESVQGAFWFITIMLLLFVIGSWLQGGVV
jgi:hypothetical protein